MNDFIIASEPLTSLQKTGLDLIVNSKSYQIWGKTEDFKELMNW